MRKLENKKAGEGCPSPAFCFHFSLQPYGFRLLLMPFSSRRSANLYGGFTSFSTSLFAFLIAESTFFVAVPPKDLLRFIMLSGVNFS